MYDGGSKDWNDGWPTEKYEKSQEIGALHTEQCCLLCWQGYGVQLLWLIRLEELLSNQSNRRIGLERLSTLRYFHRVTIFDMILNS